MQRDAKCTSGNLFFFWAATRSVILDFICIYKGGHFLSLLQQDVLTLDPVPH